MRHSKRVLLLLNILLLLIGMTFLVSFYERRVTTDDAWLGEYAYWFAKLGYVKSELFRGFEHYEHKLVVYHKLFIMQGGLLIRLFGLNLYILKSISLVYLFIVLWLAYLIIKRYFDDVKISYRMFLILFLFNHLTLQAAFRFRPEIMLSAFGLLSYYYLDKGIHTKKTVYIMFAGVWGGLAVCCHLNGAMYILAGIIILIVARHLRYAFFFGISAVIGGLPYFYDMTTLADLKLWLRQFFNDPALGSTDFQLLGSFSKLLNEIDRFFHSPPEVCLSCMLIMIGFWSFRYLKTEYRQLCLYTGCLMLGIGMFAHSKTTKYMLVYLPFLCILITLGLHYIAVQAPKYVYQYLVPFAVGAYMLVNYIIILILIGQNWNVVAFHRAVAAHIPVVSKIFAPLPFLYNEIEHYSIQGLNVYGILKGRKMISSNTTPFQFAEQFGNEYCIVNEDYIQLWHLTDPVNFGNYELIHKEILPNKEKEYWIFKRTGTSP